MLVTVPTNKGDDLIERSGMGDELNFVPTDKQTLRSVNYENVFALGDATDLPSSKAGSVAHFQADILFENILATIEGRPLRAHFDGHANCFIESGFGKGLLIDFNYDTEPLPGKFPLPGVGPFSLLEETKMNHYGKMMFRWVYWNLLLRGAELADRVPYVDGRKAGLIMDNAKLSEQLAALDRKLDLISGEMEALRRYRLELEDLKDDLTRVAKDVFQTAIEEMEEVAPFVHSGDFVHLARKLVRNTRNLATLTTQVESAMDFTRDATPLGKELFNDLLSRLDELDRKGYFEFIRELFNVADRVVTTYSVEDVRLLADNVVAILETVKGLTQPEMLQSINNAMVVYRKLDFDSVEEISLWKAFREINRPEMRRALGFLMTFMRNLSEHPTLNSSKDGCGRLRLGRSLNPQSQDTDTHGYQDNCRKRNRFRRRQLHDGPHPVERIDRRGPRRRGRHRGADRPAHGGHSVHAQGIPGEGHRSFDPPSDQGERGSDQGTLRAVPGRTRQEGRPNRRDQETPGLYLSP